MAVAVHVGLEALRTGHTVPQQRLTHSRPQKGNNQPTPFRPLNYIFDL